MKNILIQVVVLLTAVLSCAAREKGFFENPVISGDIPDPTIIRIGNRYYAAGTSSEWAPFYPMFVSKDLVNWKQTGHVFTEKPEWASGSFWAPELFSHEGKIYCYYTARQKSSGISYIGVAVADSPSEKFTDFGPLVEYGSEAIDAFVFDDNGQLYISWKAYGLDKRPIELLCSKLSDDGLRLEGEPFSLLKDDERIGMEGQYQFKKGDYYYIIYSAHGCCGPGSDYDVYVARSKNFRGPYEKFSGNPILHGDESDFQSCGHGTVAETPDGRMFYLCHAYANGDDFFIGRQPVLHELEMTEDGWLRFKTGETAVRSQETPFRGTVQKRIHIFEDMFRSRKLKHEWTWNYGYSNICTETGAGRLVLTGTPVGGSASGAALCVRPSSPHYTCETEVLNSNNSMKGLTVYGDDKNFIFWGTEGAHLTLKSVTEGRERTIFSKPEDGKVFLKMDIEYGSGDGFSFLWSNDGINWNRAVTAFTDTASLIRWDRMPRPGLMHNGDSEEPAIFGYFRIKYR